MADEPLIIKLSSHYYFGRLDRLIRQLEPLLALNEPRPVTMDLSGLTGIGPSCLALIIAAMIKTVDDGLLGPGSWFIEPSSPPVARYVDRMNLRALVLPPSGESEPFARGPEEGFMSCRRFHDLAAGVDVARSLADHLQERCSTDTVSRASIYLALGELTDNVVYHAATDLGGFAMCQHYKARETFEIAIVDLGIGIMQSLAANPELPTPATGGDALDLALTPRVTSTPQRNAGLGLFVTAMLLQANGGQFYLRSGDALAMRGAESRTEAGKVVLRGTLATLQVRTDRPLDIEQVYARFKKDLGHADD
jgi:anti-sigma regulatory factor (Ser/Thr protein kinase)